MAAPAFGTLGTLLGGSTSTTVAMPAASSIAIDDMLITLLYVESTATVTSTDFTEAPGSPVINATAGSLHRLHAYWKRAVAGDVGHGTYSFTGSTGYRNGIMARFTGVVTSGVPFDTGTGAPVTGAASSASTTSPALSLTTTGADRLLLWLCCNFAGGLWSPPGTFAERSDNDGQGMSTLAQAAAGSTGSLTGAATSSGVISNWLGALLPVGAVTTPPVPIIRSRSVAVERAAFY